MDPWKLFAKALVIAGAGFFLVQAPASAGIVTTDLCLPQHKYVKLPPPIHYPVPRPGDVFVDDVLHFGFSDCFALPRIRGDFAIHRFGSLVSGVLSIPALLLTQPFLAPAQVTVQIVNVDPNPLDNMVLFDTEMLQLDLSGGTLPPGAMIRESPTLPSRGQTTVTDLGAGSFRIDSFFDVFTELSLDGGLTFVPARGPAHVELMPEPGALMLLAAGLALLALGRRARAGS
jgi:hypothetical protein